MVQDQICLEQTAGHFFFPLLPSDNINLLQAKYEASEK
jgi:hypothetical protein